MPLLHDLEIRVLDLCMGVDAAVAGFAARTGLSCPEGCGHCCLSAQVEATVLECIPLAFLLFRTSQAEQVLDLLEQNGDAHRCILYRPDLTRAGLWGCAQYRCRPVVCRLFGFAGNRGRDGIARLAMCRIMKDMAGPERTGIVADDAAGSTMPLFVDAGLCITALHPSLGTVRMPINIALWEALMKVGMALNLTTKASGEES